MFTAAQIKSYTIIMLRPYLYAEVAWDTHRSKKTAVAAKNLSTFSGLW